MNNELYHNLLIAYFLKFSFPVAVKCAGVQSCVVFMPRIDLWAVETHFEVAESFDDCSTNNQLSETEESCLTSRKVVEKKSEFNSKKRKSIDMAKGQVILRASHAWMSFIQQVDSIGASTSLMILVWIFVMPAINNCPQAILHVFKA